MKNIFNKRIVVGAMAVAMAMLTNNCTNLTNGLSTDPVNITDPSVIASSKYLSGIEVSLIGVFEAEQARGTGMWAGYFNGADRQYTGLGNYVTSGQDYDNIWNTIYANILEDCKLIKHNANPAKNFVTVGITQVIEAMVVGLAADCWGDVPFTQAAQFPVIATPAFDKQAAVYASAQALLDSAITNLGLSGNGTGDFLLNGGKAAWIAVAHTVKARLYLHTRDYANAIAQASSPSAIKSAAGNLMALHGGAYLQTFNLYYSFLSYDRSGYMAADSYAPTLLDVTSPNSRNNAKTDETARLNYIYWPGGGLNFHPGTVAYEPNVICDDFTEPQQSWPSTSDGFFAATASFPLVTYQENLLILAEAYMKQATPDPTNALAALNTLRTYYNNGAPHVNPDYATGYTYNYTPYVYADFGTGGIDNNGTDTQDQALLREILEERYITLLGQIEGWNDMRRTGNFLKIPLAAGKADFPRRLLYSQGEVTTNSKNVPSSGVGLYDPVASFSTAY